MRAAWLIVAFCAPALGAADETEQKVLAKLKECNERAKSASFDEQIKCIREVHAIDYKSMPEPPPADRTKIGKWQIARRTDKMRDFESVSMGVEAEEAIEFWPQQRSVPYLFVRCSDGQLSSILISNGAVAQVNEKGDTEMQIRLDDGPVFPVLVQPDTSLTNYFLPYTGSQLLEWRRYKLMRIEFTPAASVPVVVTFKLDGFEEAYREVSHACLEDDWWHQENAAKSD